MSDAPAMFVSRTEQETGGQLRGRQHIAIGAGSAALAFGAMQSAGTGIDLGALVPVVMAAAAGSLGPDLDHPGSLASMGIPITLITYAGVFLFVRGWELSHPGGLPIGAAAVGPAWVSGAWLALGAGVALVAVSFALGRVFGHRGIVHSIAFGLGATALVAIGLLASGASVFLAIPFAWGWLAHLAADATTSAGLKKVLWPLGARL